MRHSFNQDGRCVHCDIPWSKATGTACDTERTDLRLVPDPDDAA